MFCDSTLAALTRAGYTTERRVDAGVSERALTAHGFTPPARVRTFLERFGNLTVSLPHPTHSNVAMHFHFDAARSASSVFREKVDDLAARAGAPLFPVGEGLGGVLLMDPAGALYAALDDWFVKLGSTPEEAIEELCSGGSGTTMA